MIDQLIVRLARLGQTMATAESLTGGLVAATVVDVPGSSAVLRGGLVVYATELKHSLAGVDADLLAAEGPVSPAVAVSLARGARLRCGADWGVATTGVAGPDPQDGKPVGTVFVAVSGPTAEEVRELHLAGDRPTIRAATVKAALDLLASVLADDQ
jgi:nicotinamide-nucleotide amidase